MTRVIEYTPENLKLENPDVTRTDVCLLAVSDLSCGEDGELYYYVKQGLLAYSFVKDIAQAKLLSNDRADKIMEIMSKNDCDHYYTHELGFTGGIIVHKIPVALINTETTLHTYHL